MQLLRHILLPNSFKAKLYVEKNWGKHFRKKINAACKMLVKMTPGLRQG